MRLRRVSALAAFASGTVYEPVVSGATPWVRKLSVTRRRSAPRENPCWRGDGELAASRT